MATNGTSDACNGCESHHDDGCTAHPKDIEDMEQEMCLLQERMRDLSAQLAARRIDPHIPERKLRSRHWFGREDDPSISSLYIERYLNYGLTRQELMSGKPIIGIANSGSDIAPCNRHHIQLAKRVREGIRTAGGIAFEFPTHPIQETSRRPTATLDRNLSYLTLVELLHAYPFDGVVLMTGCDKTTPAALMAAATMDIPSVCLNVGPMLNGWKGKKMIGAGTIVWEARELHGAGKITYDGMIDMVSHGTPSDGHCNTMGTASTMNALAEALGMTLPGAAAIPAPYRERGQMAYETGVEIVSMVHADRKPSDIMTRKAFENAIVANTAIGGSTNAPIHLIAISKHVGIEPPLTLDDWEGKGYNVPLMVNLQPAGAYLGEDYHRAGGLPTVMAELLKHGKIHGEVLTANGKTWEENTQRAKPCDDEVIRSYEQPLKSEAGFLHMKGNIFDSAIMKTSVIGDAFRDEFLRNPEDPNAFEGKIVVFDGPEDYHHTLEERDVDARTIMIMRGTGPLGYPGAAEVVNMTAPTSLLKSGLKYSLPCIGDGRQSGTSASPSILNASPEAAENGNLAILRDGDIVRIDLGKRRVDVKISEEEIAERRRVLMENGGYGGKGKDGKSKVPRSQTPWQEMFRGEAGPLSGGMVFEKATRFRGIGRDEYIPRDNH